MANIINGSVIPFLQVGGRTFTDLSNLKVLYGHVVGAGNGNCTLRENNTSSGYVVPVGKTFKALAIKITVITSNSSSTPNNLLYADADVGLASSTAFTNPVYIINSSAYYGLPSVLSTSNNQIESSIKFDVIAGKYLCFTNGGSVFAGSIEVFGYEV